MTNPVLTRYHAPGEHDQEDHGNWADGISKPLEDITAADLVATDKPMRFPKGSYQGELVGKGEKYIGNVYLREGRVYVGEPRAGGYGEVTKRLPGTFSPKAFKRAGGLQLSSSQRVKYWRFKTQTELSNG